MRGLMISRHMQFSERGAFMLTTTDNSEAVAQDWRAAILLWDRLINPTLAAFNIADTAESALLKQEGVLREVPVGNGSFRLSADGENTMQRDFLAFYKRLDAEEPGTWTISRGAGALSMIMDADGDEGRGLLLRLSKALPVPNVDVPLADILHFRSKRAAELQALHAALGRIYQGILVAADRPLAQLDAFSELEAAVSNQIRVSMESPFRWRLANIELRYDIPAAIQGVFLSSAAAVTLDPSAAHASPLMAAAGLLNGIRLSAGPSLGLRDRNSTSHSPFDYVGAYHSEVFGGRSQAARCSRSISALGPGHRA